MSKRNDIQETNKLLVSCLDKYQHVVIQCFKSKGDVYEVDIKTTFSDAEFDQIMLEVENSDAN